MHGHFCCQPGATRSVVPPAQPVYQAMQVLVDTRLPCAGLVLQAKSATMSCLDLLPVEILARVLALASAELPVCDYMGGAIEPHIVPVKAGQLMTTCKRFAAAINTAAFWQESWMFSENAALYMPCHSQWITRMTVDLFSQDPSATRHKMATPWFGRDFSYQPLLSSLRHLHVSPQSCWSSVMVCGTVMVTSPPFVRCLQPSCLCRGMKCI